MICDFCGFVAQVKTARRPDPENVAPTYLGGAWRPQKERMDAGIYTTLYLVNAPKSEALSENACFLFFLPAEAQEPEMFVPREPLGPNARRAGWQGFRIELGPFVERVIALGRGVDREEPALTENGSGGVEP
jgi:type II restriction enzyme